MTADGDQAVGGDHMYLLRDMQLRVCQVIKKMYISISDVLCSEREEPNLQPLLP